MPAAPGQQHPTPAFAAAWVQSPKLPRATTFPRISKSRLELGGHPEHTGNSVALCREARHGACPEPSHRETARCTVRSTKINGDKLLQDRNINAARPAWGEASAKPSEGSRQGTASRPVGRGHPRQQQGLLRPPHSEAESEPGVSWVMLAAGSLERGDRQENVLPLWWERSQPCPAHPKGAPAGP